AHATDPGCRVRLETDAAALGEHEKLPDYDRRQPELIEWILELCRHRLGQPAGLQEAPEKDVCVEEKLQDRKASHSLSATGGETMSPVILPVALKEPNHEAGFFGGGGGTICEIGTVSSMRASYHGHGPWSTEPRA